MDSRPYLLREAAGFLAGLAMAPIFAAGSWLRRARLFHPRGVTYRATVFPMAATPALSHLADRLAGGALVRLSEGWWKNQREWPDVLGVAIRFGEFPTESAAGSGTLEAPTQDLLTASSPSISLLPLALLTTDQHDYLNNTYYAMTPFQVEGVGYVYLRLSPPRMTSDVAGRTARLEAAVARGEARFVLELRTTGLTGSWLPVVEVRLVEKVEVDQAALRFSPFRDGLGLVPRGFVNAMRPAAYAGSQWARPKYTDLGASVQAPTVSSGAGTSISGASRSGGVATPVGSASGASLSGSAATPGGSVASMSRPGAPAARLQTEEELSSMAALAASGMLDLPLDAPGGGKR